MPCPRLLPVAAALAAVLIGGCGGSDETAVIERPVIRFELDEYRIAPQDVTIRPGRVKLQARNVGGLPHNLKIQLETPDEDEPYRDIAALETVMGGREAAAVKVTLRPGDYRLVCTIANHDDLGQYGELHVEE